MEFIGDEDGTPAPRIADLKMEKNEAEEAFRQSVRNLKLIVRSGRHTGIIPLSIFFGTMKKQ